MTKLCDALASVSNPGFTTAQLTYDQGNMVSNSPNAISTRMAVTIIFFTSAAPFVLGWRCILNRSIRD